MRSGQKWPRTGTSGEMRANRAQSSLGIGPKSRQQIRAENHAKHAFSEMVVFLRRFGIKGLGQSQTSKAEVRPITGQLADATASQRKQRVGARWPINAEQTRVALHITTWPAPRAYISFRRPPTALYAPDIGKKPWAERTECCEVRKRPAKLQTQIQLKFKTFLFTFLLP